jgi:geranylgeranyl pyrophosphate synthase
LGLAFQIADDIIDARGDAAASGHGETGHKEQHKATYPLVVGIVQARQRLSELLQSSLRELAPFGARAVPLGAIAQHLAARALTTQAEKFSLKGDAS